MVERSQSSRKQWLPWLALGLVTLTALIGLARILMAWRHRPTAPGPVDVPPDQDHFSGLTEEEAISRRPPSLEELQQGEAGQVRREIWRTSTLSIFNLGMLGLAIAQTSIAK